MREQIVFQKNKPINKLEYVISKTAQLNTFSVFVVFTPQAEYILNKPNFIVMNDGHYI